MLFGIPRKKVTPENVESGSATPRISDAVAAGRIVGYCSTRLSPTQVRRSSTVASTGERVPACLRVVFAVALRAIVFGALGCTVVVVYAGNVSSADVHVSEQNPEIRTTAEATVAEARVSKEVLWKRAIDRDDTAAIRRLISEVDFRLPNDKGKTALMAAAKTGELDLLEMLLDLGLQLDDRSFTGGTSLMYAALGRQYSMIRYLLNAKRGASDFRFYVDAASTNGWTAVMIAAAKGFDGVLQQLVEEGGADVWLASTSSRWWST